MKVLFAVGNENTSQAIIKKYQAEYKQIISYKNVYYFNAILKELQRDKTYDRVVISEDLEQYVNNDYEQMDKFLFDKLDSISDEASNAKGEDIPIILICSERRTKSEPLLVKLFGIGIYNAIIGNDRSAAEVCKLINRPRLKKEAKAYYKIDSEDVTYGKEDENDVSEIEIQNILAHYKKIANEEDKYVTSFDSIAEQYNDKQLRVISKCLPLNVRAVLEEKSEKYQQVNSFNNKISDNVRYEKKEEKKGTSEVLLKNEKVKNLDKPVVIPSAIDASKKKKVLIKKASTTDAISQSKKSQDEEELEDIELDELPEIEEIPQEEYMPETTLPEMEEDIQPLKRGRGRPRKNTLEPANQQAKRGRGRPKKIAEVEETEEEKDLTLPGFEDEEDETTLPGFDDEEETVLPGFDEEEQPENSEEETEELPGTEQEDEETVFAPFMPSIPKKEEYQELKLDTIMNPEQKLVAFVGTSKNGTSFLVNNVAELLSTNGIDTAILDLTRNRNAYYIYTKNDEQLRRQSNQITSNLKNGIARGIQEHKNLTIYTSPLENDENLEDVEPIVETLVKQHAVVIMDCDFNTPARYFKYAQEIFLVQSMDTLTIQPLTAFVRKLLGQEMYDSSKTRVVLNKFIKTREINEKILIGGMSIYNDPEMTVRKELFDRRTVQYVTIPFDLKTYLRYLDGLVTCDVSLKGYDKEFILALKKLANMVYPIQGAKKADKYMPPSVRNNDNGGFSPRINSTLDQMRKNY